MSYILDALKKSEAERSNRDNPEFGHRVPFESAPRRQREIWPYLLVLALLANAVVIVYVMWPESTPGDVGVASQEPTPVQRQEPVAREVVKTAPEPPAEKPAEKPSEKGRVEPEEGEATPSPEVVAESTPKTKDRAAEPPDPAEPSVQGDQTVSSTAPAEKKTEVPPIAAMPRSVQQRVPNMTFNAHLHSSRPSSRRVMINNRMLGEGDRVGQLVIKEITPAGVVFRLDQHVFEIDVVRDWQGAL